MILKFFQFFKVRHNKVENCTQFSSSIDKINDLLRKNGKDASLKPYPALQPIDRLGPLIFELIINDYRSTQKIDLHFMHDLLITIKNFKILNVNGIKNFLNQTLLHFACENNQAELCKLLVEYGADCTLEDNYLQTPLIMAAKRNFFQIIKVFSTSINEDEYKNEILRAAYHACCSGNCQIVEHLFLRFDLCTEDLVNVKELSRVSELNPLHVCCYKSYSNILTFLAAKFRNSDSITKYLNLRFNEYRDSTALEEAFKGFVSLYSTSETNFLDKKMQLETKIFDFKNIISFLIENGARFSTNFSVTNGLIKLGSQSFTTSNKDLDFFHFLNCCNYLFRFKISEIFVFNDSSQMEIMIDEFIRLIYTICSKVVKDVKSKCFNAFIDLVLGLHYTGQYYVVKDKLNFLKDKNMDILNFLVETTRKNLTLKHFCVVSIRNSIPSYGIEKVKCLNVPNELRKEVFFNSLSTKTHPQFDYYTFLLFKSIDNNSKLV